VERESQRAWALTRCREIKNTVDLMRPVFPYLTEGKSFSGTAVLLKLAGICSMNLYEFQSVKKFINCGETSVLTSFKLWVAVSRPEEEYFLPQSRKSRRRKEKEGIS
jgi:hypothetical protein